MLIADLFIDALLGEKFRKDGFVTLPLLNADDVALLNAVFNRFESKAQVQQGFYTSIWSTNKAYRREIDEQLKMVLFKRVASHVRSVKPVFSNFMVKGSGENSSLIAHQDWAFVEEPEFDSATVWIPLVDVNSLNGNLQVVPGSHCLTNFVRGRFLENVITQIDEQELNKKLVDIPMKAGEAIILNSRLIHASPPNLSNQKRIAVSVVVAPEEAPLFHWIVNEQSGEKNLRKISITPDFFWQYNYDDKLLNLSAEDTKHYTNRPISDFGWSITQPLPKAKGVRSWFQDWW